VSLSVPSAYDAVSTTYAWLHLLLLGGMLLSGHGLFHHLRSSSHGSGIILAGGSGDTVAVSVMEGPRVQVRDDSRGSGLVTWHGGCTCAAPEFSSRAAVSVTKYSRRLGTRQDTIYMSIETNKARRLSVLWFNPNFR